MIATVSVQQMFLIRCCSSTSILNNVVDSFVDEFRLTDPRIDPTRQIYIIRDARPRWLCLSGWDRPHLGIHYRRVQWEGGAVDWGSIIRTPSV